MGYKIFVTEEFEREFSRLDKTIKQRVIAKIKELKYDPKIGKPLRYGLKGLWSLRIGKYRVIYTIREDEIYLITIKHRKKAYR